MQFRSTANPRGEAISTGNGRSGSSFHHNLIARSRNPSGVNVIVFNPTAGENVPSYMDFHHNVEYQWAAPGQVIFNGGTYAGTQIHATYSYNVWSDSTSGTNSNNGSKSYPNPYTAAQLFAALGYSDKQALIDYVILHPEANVQQTARSLLFAGYGVP